MRGRQLLVTFALVLAALLVLGIAVVDAVQGHRQHPQAGGAAADAGAATPAAAATAAGKATGTGDAAGRSDARAGTSDPPTPAEEPTPTPDNADPVTMNADAQAGGDNFGIQSGSGGGSSGVGRGGAGNATYGRYLGYLMQQAISRDDKVKRLAFQLQVNVCCPTMAAWKGRAGARQWQRGGRRGRARCAATHRQGRPGTAAVARFPARVLIQPARGLIPDFRDFPSLMRTVMNDHDRARTDSRCSRPARRALLCCAVLLSLAAGRCDGRRNHHGQADQGPDRQWRAEARRRPGIVGAGRG